MKTLTIIGRRWFNRRCGHTYFSAVGLVDGRQVAHIEYAYGYGSQYEDSILRVLAHGRYLPEPLAQYAHGGVESAFRYCERLGIQYSNSVTDVGRKKDL